MTRFRALLGAAVLALALMLVLASCGGGTKTVTQTTTRPTVTLGPPDFSKLCLSYDTSTHCILKQLPPSQRRVGAPPKASFHAYGLDGWGPPDVGFLKANHYQFGFAYTSYTPSKNWNGGAVHAYRRAKLGLGDVWETSAQRTQSGYFGGRADAVEAQRQAAGLGNLFGPIEGAVDWQAPCTQFDLLAYFKGWHDVLGGRAMIYGGYDQIKCAFNHHLVGRENWQTLAWSGGRWLPASIAPLEQFGFIGSKYDINRALAPNYGQWWPRGQSPPPGAAILDHHVRVFHLGRITVRAREYNTYVTAVLHGCHLGAPRRPTCVYTAQHLRLLDRRLLRVVKRYHRGSFRWDHAAGRHHNMSALLARR